MKSDSKHTRQEISSGNGDVFFFKSKLQRIPWIDRITDEVVLRGTDENRKMIRAIIRTQPK